MKKIKIQSGAPPSLRPSPPPSSKIKKNILMTFCMKFIYFMNLFYFYYMKDNNILIILTNGSPLLKVHLSSFIIRSRWNFVWNIFIWILVDSLNKISLSPLLKIFKSSFIIWFLLHLVWNTFIKHHYDSRTTASSYITLVSLAFRHLSVDRYSDPFRITI